MNTTDGGGRLRACRDRCEVCHTVLIERPASNRRRCADHLDQLVLVPAALVRKKPTKSEQSSKSTNAAGEGSK